MLWEFWIAMLELVGGFLGLGPRYEDSKFDLEAKIALRTYLRTH